MKIEGLNLRMKSENVLRMAGLIVILILHSSFFIHKSEAQTFTDRLRQYEDGKGRVNITQSAEVEDLVNNAVLVPNQQPTPQQSAQAQQNQTTPQRQPQQYVQPQTAPTKSPNPNTSSIPNSSTTNTTTTTTTTPPTQTKTPQQQQQPTETEESTIDTRKKVIKGGHKAQGFRVQVFSGGNSRADRQKAERIGAAMKSHFPDQPIYVHFYSPSWKCRMGNYRTAEEARLILSQVKQLGYGSACIVKGPITVQ